MSSINTQFLNLGDHHSVYSEIDPAASLKGSAAEKTVFISGASRGIGRATAAAFAKAGAGSVYITARSEKALKETSDIIAAANPETECAYRACDVTNAVQVEDAVSDCVTKFGKIDIADANAGYLDNWKKIGELDIESWWKSWEVKIKGAYHVARFCIPHLIESAHRLETTGKSGGHLIFISSVGAQLLTPGASDYQASKHAVNRICEFVDVDHAEDGIKSFAVHPGGVATALAKNMPDEMHPFLNDAPELAAGFIVWLCSGKADWAKGRYLSSNWDINKLMQMKDKIISEDLLVNRLRTKA